jgi:hypothetical protein
MIDPGTVEKVGAAISAVNWAGVVIILSALIPIYIWLFLQFKKNKSEPTTISEEQLNILLTKIQIDCPISQKNILTDIFNRLTKNREIIEDVKTEVYTVKVCGVRVEEGLERISRNLLELLDSIRRVIKK